MDRQHRTQPTRRHAKSLDRGCATWMVRASVKAPRGGGRAGSRAGSRVHARGLLVLVLVALLAGHLAGCLGDGALQMGKAPASEPEPSPQPSGAPSEPSSDPSSSPTGSLPVVSLPMAGAQAPMPMQAPSMPLPMVPHEEKPGINTVDCDITTGPVVASNEMPFASPMAFEMRLNEHGFQRIHPDYSDLFRQDGANWQLLYLFVEATSDIAASYGAGDVTHALDMVDCQNPAVSDATRAGLQDVNLLIHPPPFDAALAAQACERFKAGVTKGYVYDLIWAPDCGSQCGGGIRTQSDPFDWYAFGDGQVEVMPLETGDGSCALGELSCTDACYAVGQLFEFRSDWPPPATTTTVCVPVDEQCSW